MRSQPGDSLAPSTGLDWSELGARIRSAAELAAAIHLAQRAELAAEPPRPSHPARVGERHVRGSVRES